MVDSANCARWCEWHYPGDSDCQFSLTITATEPSIQPDFSRGLPPEVNEIRLNAWRDEDSKAPYVELEFWRTDDGRDEPTCRVFPSLEDLEQIHGRIGEAIRTLRQS